MPKQEKVHWLPTIIFHFSYWNRLEMYCRDLARRYSSVHVISGPLYLPSEPVEEGGKKFVKYQVMSNQRISFIHDTVEPLYKDTPELRTPP